MSLIIGRKPVLEALRAGQSIEKIFILAGHKGPAFEQIIQLARQKKILCKEIAKNKFFELTQDANAQGIIALKSEIKYHSLEELVDKVKIKPLPLLLILDTIQDPHNLGAILRSAECAGVDGVILTKHNSATITEVVTKTAAGATEHLKICKINNLDQTIKYLKEHGFWIAGSTLEGARDYTSQNYKLPLALIMGNEEKGIRPLTAKNCDFLIKIPMEGKIQSLNVSVASGILLFEILRQRSNG